MAFIIALAIISIFILIILITAMILTKLTIYEILNIDGFTIVVYHN